MYIVGEWNPNCTCRYKFSCIAVDKE